MSGQERLIVDIEGLIDVLKDERSPVASLVERSLAEVYTSDNFDFFALKGGSKENMTVFLGMVRMVLLTENGELASIVFPADDIDGASREDPWLYRVIKKMEVALDGIEFNLDRLQPLTGNALKRVRQTGLVTVAAMHLGEDTRTGEEVIQVAYPKVFVDLVSFKPETKKYLGFYMACYFLKNTPIGLETFEGLPKSYIH